MSSSSVSSSVSSSAKHIFARFFPKTPPRLVRRGIPREKTPPDTKPMLDEDHDDVTVIMQIAEGRRLAKQHALGTELEQLTRNYKARLADSLLPASAPASADQGSKSVSPLPTMEYFDAQIMLLEPQRALENAKQKLSQPITELLLRALSIFRAAWDAGVTGYSNLRMNTVVRSRLREVLDFAEDDPATTGVVSQLEAAVPLSSDFSCTIEYFNKLEFKQSPESSIKAKLRAYFAKMYGVRDDAKKQYTFIPVLSVLEMTIEAIVDEAVLKFCNNPRINRRTKKSMKGRFQDHLVNLQRAELLTGNTLKMRCMRRVEGLPRVEGESNDPMRGLHGEGGNIDIDVDFEKSHNKDDINNGESFSAVDISCLRQRPVNMSEEDAWLLLSVIGLDENGVIRKEEPINAKTAASSHSVVGSRRVLDETAMEQRTSDNKKRTKRKKTKKIRPRKHPQQKWSKRKKMRKLRELLDQKEAQERVEREAKYHTLHANTEGEEYKKRAYRPSKAAIMLNEKNFYDDARLHTRRPGSRASVFEPALENTSFGRAHGLDVERDPTRAANYTFRQPKGILKALAEYDSKHVRRTRSRDFEAESRPTSQELLNSPENIALQRHVSTKALLQKRSTQNSPVLLQKSRTGKTLELRKKNFRKVSSTNEESLQKASRTKSSPYKLQDTASSPPHATMVTRSSLTKQTSPIVIHADGPLRKKARDLLENKHERSARFGSLRNLDRAIEHSRQMRVEIAAISTTADTSKLKFNRPGGEVSDSIGSRCSSRISNIDLEMSVPRSISQQSLGSRSDIGQLDIGQGLEFDKLNDAAAGGGDNLEEEDEEEGSFENMDDYEDYDEDYDEYWDDEYVEYDAQAESVNKIESQLRMLQKTFAKKVAENGKGLSAKASARVPGLPRGFITGQIAMTRTAQRKHDVQNRMVQLFLKNVNKHGESQRKAVYEKVDKAKKRKPRPPRLIELIIKLFSKKKSPVQTKDQLLAKLKGSQGKIPLQANINGDAAKSDSIGGAGIEKLNEEKGGEQLEAQVTEAPKTIDTAQNAAEEDLEGDGITESKEEGDEKMGNQSTDGGGAEKSKEGNASNNDGSDDEEEEEEDIDPAIQQAINDLKSKNDRMDQRAQETLRNFQIYLNECKSQYRVISGEERTHATNFRDMYSEWLVRNRANRTHFGWDPDPPPPPPRRRERPLNKYALKRIQKERDREAGIVTIAGEKYSAKELFERKRIARRNARPPNLAVRIWRFFI